ncbi:hypothetical protein U1Q18_041993 [Sarracenia purpurea var. burkii]
MPFEDSKPVKNEEVEEENDGSVLENRKKKSNNAIPKSRPQKQAKVKKEEAEEDHDFEKPISKKSSNKFQKVQKKTKVKEDEKKKGVKEAQKNGNKRERKVYDLPGQKRDPPEERDPLRIFYETLYVQVPGSEMAAFWMMESGLLSKEVANKVYEKKQKKNQQQKLGSPMKKTIVSVKKSSQSVSVKKSSKSVTVKRKSPSSPASSPKKKTPDSKSASKQSKKRKIDGDDSSEDDSDDDYVLAKQMTKKQKAV